MRIIKLHTIDSTNNYLKEWIRIHEAENFMLVVTDSQTKGRGQMGTHWLSKSGKNLTFSMFVGLEQFSIERQFQLNQAVSLGLLFALKNHLPQVKIKWPNDILADTKKIAGILIENTVSSRKIKHSIIGIGLNVNQTEFPDELSQVTSLKTALDRDFDLDSLLVEIRDSIKKQILLLDILSVDKMQELYLENLYLYKTTSIFFSKDKKMFKGMIDGVANDGRLLIKTPSKKILAFGFKEVRFL